MFSYHIHLASSCCRRFTHVPKPFFVVAVVVLPTVNNSDQHFQKNEEAPPSNFVPFGCCVGSSVHWLWTGSTRHCLLFHVATSKRDTNCFTLLQPTTRFLFQHGPNPQTSPSPYTVTPLQVWILSLLYAGRYLHNHSTDNCTTWRGNYCQTYIQQSEWQLQRVPHSGPQSCCFDLCSSGQLRQTTSQHQICHLLPRIPGNANKTWLMIAAMTTSFFPTECSDTRRW